MESADFSAFEDALLDMHTRLVPTRQPVPNLTRAYWQRLQPYSLGDVLEIIGDWRPAVVDQGSAWGSAFPTAYAMEDACRKRVERRDWAKQNGYDSLPAEDLPQLPQTTHSRKSQRTDWTGLMDAARAKADAHGGGDHIPHMGKMVIGVLETLKTQINPDGRKKLRR